MNTGRRKGLPLATAAVLLLAVTGGSAKATAADSPWTGTWSMSMGVRSGPEPGIKKVRLKVYAAASSKGSAVVGIARPVWPGGPDNSELSFRGKIGGSNDNVVTGTFNLYNFRDHYTAAGKIVAKLATAPSLPNGRAVFTARLRSPKGKSVATIQAIRLTNTNPFPFGRGSVPRTLSVTPAWSKKTVAPGTSVKLTVTIRATAKEDLPAGAARILFSVPTRVLTDVTGVNARTCGQHDDEKSAQTTVTCIPFDLGAGRRTKVIFLLHVPSGFAGKRLSVGMKLLDANAKDPFDITASRRTATIALQGGGGTTTTRPTKPTPTPSPKPTGAAPLPTAAVCQPKTFTMEYAPYGTGRTFTVELSRFDPAPAGNYVAKCTWVATNDQSEAFVAWIDVTPPGKGEVAGSCDNRRKDFVSYPYFYYYSKTRYLTVDGAARKQDTQAVGGNETILKNQVLRGAEKQGVGLSC